MTDIKIENKFSHSLEDEKGLVITPEGFKEMTERRMMGMSSELKEEIRAGVQSEELSVSDGSFTVGGRKRADAHFTPKGFSVLGKSAIAAVVILIVTIGSVFALSYGGFGLFFSQDDVSRLNDREQQIYSSTTVDDVKMSIEGFVDGGYQYMMVVSFENLGEEVWDEKVYSSYISVEFDGSEDDDTQISEKLQKGTGVSLIHAPVLSQDGRKLSYLYESNKAFNSQMLKVSAGEIYKDSMVKEADVYIPIDEVFEKNAIEVTNDYPANSFSYDLLRPYLEGLDHGSGIILDEEYPRFKLVGGARIEADHRQEYDDNQGLYLLIYDDGTVSPGGNPAANEITISEITNVKTGEVLRCLTSEEIKKTNEAGEIGRSTIYNEAGDQFYICYRTGEIPFTADLTDYVITKVRISAEREMIHNGPWEVEAGIKNITDSKKRPVTSVAGHTSKGRKEVPYEGYVTLSPIGITVSGQFTNEKDIGKEMHNFYLNIKAYGKDGREIPVELKWDQRLGDEGAFIRTYGVSSDDGSWKLLDIDQVAYVELNGVRVDMK